MPQSPPVRHLLSLLLLLTLTACGDEPASTPELPVDTDGQEPTTTVEIADPLLAGQEGAEERQAREAKLAEERRVAEARARIRGQLESEDPSAVRAGLEAVRTLGADGFVYVDEVLPLLDSESLAGDVVQTLTALGPQAVEVTLMHAHARLQDAWHYDGTGKVHHAHASLHKLVTSWGDLALPHVMSMLSDEQAATWAAGTLDGWRQGGRVDVARAVPTSIDVLDRASGPSKARAAVLRFLAGLGDRGAPATSALVRVLDDPDVSATDRLNAVRALGGIGSRASEALPVLERLQEDEAWRTGRARVVLAEAIAAIRKAG